MSKDKSRDSDDLNKRRAENTAPPEEGPKKSKAELAEEKETESTKRGITLRLRERDGTLNEDETEELNKINEAEAKAGKASKTNE